MIEAFREGGWGMILMLVTALGMGAFVVAGPARRRAEVCSAAMVILLAEGILGLSTGMKAVSDNFGRFPDKTEAIGIGLGELSHNGTFCVMLTALFGIGYLLTRPASAARSGT